jgi:hypothetical protein
MKYYVIQIAWSQTDQPKFVMQTAKDKSYVEKTMKKKFENAFWVEVQGPYKEIKL